MRRRRCVLHVSRCVLHVSRCVLHVSRLPVPRRRVDGTAGHYPAVIDAPTIDQPISLEAVIGFLVRNPLFGELDPEDRAEVVRIMEVQRLQLGEEAFHQGDPGDAWYVIFEGQVEVVAATPSGREQRLAVMEAGSGFGEIAMLDGAARSATIRALGPVTLFRFGRRYFDELLEQGSLGAYKLVLAMAREMSAQVRRLTDQVTALSAGSAIAST